MRARISYDLSRSRLRELGLLDQDDDPPMPKRLPQYDDEEPLGVSKEFYSRPPISLVQTYDDHLLSAVTSKRRS
jgi:hypothetical protein